MLTAWLIRLFDWRRVLVYTHRWLGIAGCLVFITWFASGIVMMYARMPVLSAEERLARLAGLDLQAAVVSPDAAARAANVAAERLRVGMHLGSPVYRFFARGRWTTVSAQTGAVVEPLSRDGALAVALHFLPEHAASIRYDAYLQDSDQWTFSVRALMPMHRLDIGDEAGTYLYVSDQTGEPVMKTTTRQRVWGFLGAVLHWIYFTPLRQQSALWNDVIVWSSIAGIVMCLSGLTWGLWRWSPRSPYRLKRSPSMTPYAGLMAWHHYAGLAFGLVSFTWILSGLLSMSPWDWAPGTGPTARQREAVQGGPLRVDQVSVDGLRAALDAVRASFEVKELEIGQFAGEPFALAHRSEALEHRAEWDSPYFSIAPPSEHRLVRLEHPGRGTFGAFPHEAMEAAARAAMPNVDVADVSWLHEYDAYYYDRHAARPLPILRVRFGDPVQTWLYLDPGRGVIVQRYERLSRLNRWLYHGLHSLDFPYLYSRRPLWDVIVIVLSLGGLVLSATTAVPAWRRVLRRLRAGARAAGSWTSPAFVQRRGSHDREDVA